MEVGQLNKKAGFVIQARMGSTRLPGKILRPLPMHDKERTVLGWIIDSLKKSGQVKNIVLATSIDKENDCLEEFAHQHSINFIRGSEHDVLSRFARAAKEFELETVVRVTADNPIVAVEEMDELVLLHHKNNNDYTASSNLPLGMNIEIIKGNVLQSINAKTDLSAQEREHVTVYVKNQTDFVKEVIDLKHSFATEKIRLTIDYPADYATLNIVAAYSLQTGLNGLELVNYIDKNADWVWQINNDKFQVALYKNAEVEIEEAVKHLFASGFPNAASLLQNAANK